MPRLGQTFSLFKMQTNWTTLAYLKCILLYNKFYGFRVNITSTKNVSIFCSISHFWTDGTTLFILYTYYVHTYRIYPYTVLCIIPKLYMSYTHKHLHVCPVCVSHFNLYTYEKSLPAFICLDGTAMATRT